MKDFPFKTVLRQSHVTHQNMKSSTYIFEEFQHKLTVFLQTYICQNRQCQFLCTNKTKFKSQAKVEKSEIEILIG